MAQASPSEAKGAWPPQRGREVSVLNPLSPRSDQHQISPCNINAL